MTHIPDHVKHTEGRRVTAPTAVDKKLKIIVKRDLTIGEQQWVDDLRQSPGFTDEIVVEFF